MANVVRATFPLRDQLDRAQLAWHHLGAISGLLDQAAESSHASLSEVNAEHLAFLVGCVYRDLGDALDKIGELNNLGL